MAESKHTAFPVLNSESKFAGILTIADLLTARTAAEQREQSRRRILQIRWPFRNPASAAPPDQPPPTA